MKKLICILFAFISLNLIAQEQLPEGWDKVFLEGKEAYMNLVTGEITYKKPTSVAKKTMKKIEVDPSIIHKVKKGETLYAIARKYNITLDDIYKLNAGFDYNNIKVGQEIVIGYDKSKEGKVIYKVDENAHTDPSNNDVYYVKKGDTLYSIAKKNGLTVSELKHLNNLHSNVLKIGQRLKLKK